MPLTRYGPFFLVLLLFWFSPLWGQYSPKDLLQESNALFESGKYGDAMTGYAQLLSLEPGNVDYNFKYGATALYGDPSKREEAIKYLKFASGKPGVDVRVWYFLGRAYHLNYQFADAIGAYQKFAEKASKKENEQWQIAQVMETARNGQTLLSQIKDVTVLDKKKSTEREFFRLYDLSAIGGKILVTPEELLSSLDEKNNHRSLIHFRGAGTTVYFSSYGKDGKNGLDIYSAQVLPGGGYSTPVPLPGNINTPYDDDFPYMHPDGKTFYFSSKGHSSMGGYDIFRASYDPMSGTFGSPANMDFAINTPDDDIFYIADSLNRLANFASGRSSRQGDLHVYRVNVDMAPVELTLVKGSFANRISPGQRTIKITVTDAATNKRVDVQYSDPGNGDYLLSFPKSGKYKLLIEAQSSEKAHSGMVDIPQGDGLTAYLQDMELVAPSGIEKLIINNRFDQKYQGDLSALVQEMLRKRAELEINFDDVPEIVPEPVAQQPKTKDAKMAYNDAGFGAGMSNDKVLQNAYERVELFEANAAKLRAQQSLMAQQANDHYAETQRQMDLAKSLAKIDPATDGGRSSYEAAVAQWYARESLESARVAQELSEVLAKRYDEVNAKAQNERSEVEVLEADIATGDYDTALAALKAENERLKNFDRIAARVDMVAEVSLAAKEARIEADRYMRRATNMRTESEQLTSSRNSKQKQAENLKGKAATEAEIEVNRLNAEIADLEQSTRRAYDSAIEKESAAFRINDQITLLQNVDEQALQALQNKGDVIEAPASSFIMQTLNGIETVELDGNAAAAYLQQHPEALARLGGGNSLRSFQQLTGVRIADEDVALAMRESATSTKASGEKQAKPLAQKTQTITAKSEEAQLAATEQAAAEQTSGLQEDSADAVASLNEVPKITQDSQETLDVANDGFDSDNQLDEKTLTSIAEAEARKAAAMDWLSIIEESMETIEAEVARGDVAALEQNDGYVKMKAEKLNEIEEIDMLIARLQSVSPTQKRDAEQAALGEAMADVDALDMSYVIRLESKINEASSSPGFVADLRKVDGRYVKALTEIEMSGLSAPEIAQKRIELNKFLIADLTDVIENDGNKVLEVDRLVELRRIKALEIREDRAVMEGKATYVPRTADALAYSAMVAGQDGTKQAELGQVSKTESVTDNEVSALSPALKDALEKPYSWDDVVPGYIDMIAGDVDASTTEGEIRKRMDAHQSVLEKIDDDVEVFSVLITSAEALNDPRIRHRYEQLRAERKIISEMRDSDQAVLATIARDQQEESAWIEEGASAQTPSAIGTPSDANAANVEEVKAARTLEAEVDEFIADMNNEIEKQYAQSRKGNRPAAEKLLALSELHKTSTIKLTDRIDALTNALDNASSDAARDIIQIQIQKLDELLADKEQEADRYATEAESAGMMADGVRAKRDSENQAGEADSKGTVSENASSEEGFADMELEEIQIAYAEPIALDQFTFRSLQANVSGSKLDQAAARATAKRLEVAVKAEAYKTAANPIDRQAAYKEFQKVATEVKLADMELNKILKASNAAEVSFFAANNASLNQGLQGGALPADVKQQSAVLYSRSVQIEQAIAQNRDLRDELDAFDTAAYTEMLREERALITEMEEVMVALEAIVDRADKEELIAQVADETAEKEPTASESAGAPAQEKAKVADGTREVSEASLKPGSQTEIPAVPEVLVDKTSSEEPRTEEPVSATPAIEEAAKKIAAVDDPASQSIEKPQSEIDRSEDLALVEAPKVESASKDAEDEMAAAGELPVVEMRPTNAVEVAQMKGIALVDLPAERVDRIARTSPVLVNNFDFVKSETPMERFALLKAKGITAEDLDQLAPSPIELKYLSDVVIADSLKKLESLHLAAVERNFADAEERSREAERLKGSVVLETNARNKQFILDKASRVEAEAEVYYQGAALASMRLDTIQSRRQEVEQSIVGTIKAMDVAQVNKLNTALKYAPYTVVTTDLASVEETKAAPARPKTPVREQPSASDIAEAKDAAVPAAARSSAESPAIEKPDADSFKSESALVESPAPPSVEPSAKRAEIDYKGNWLNTVEIIADKTDFSDVKETMFGLADQAVYSADKPIPVDPEMPSGLIFQVQIGAFRNPIPQDLFKEIAPIMGQKLANGITRYRAGLFKGYGEAIDARNLVRGMGYKDAFVVAYVDGERLSADQARSILSQAAALLAEAKVEEQTRLVEAPRPEADAKPVAKPIAAAEAQVPVEASQPKPVVQPKADYYNDPEAAEAVQVEVVRGLFYTVQVGVYSKPVKLDQLYNLTKLNSELTEKGLIRYTSGRFNSVASAGQGKQLAVAAGVSDAFITAYFNGKRISLSEAEAVIAREGEDVLNLGMDVPVSPSDSDSVVNETDKSAKGALSTQEKRSEDENTIYVIVIGSFSDDMPQEVAVFLLERSDVQTRKIEGPGGQSMFVSSEFQNKEEAEQFLIDAKEAGITSAIMGTSVKGQIQALEAK